MDWNAPFFPDLYPKLTDPLWFQMDKATDDDSELTQLENEHTAWLNAISQKDCEVVPIGKSAAEVHRVPEEEEDDDDDEEDNDDDETESHDDDEDEDMAMDITAYNP